MQENIDRLISQAPEVVATYGIKVLLAIAVYVVGKWLAGLISRVIARTMTARGVDVTISSFTRNIVFYVLITIVVVAALGQLGVQTASFVAIIGAAGLAVGLALQGSLSNFAAGVLLIIFRPFKHGDYIEAGGTAGVVQEISIFSTILTTPDNKTVIVPNSAITGGNIVNYSTQGERRVDFMIGVSYSADISAVKAELEAIAAAEPRVIADKGVTIGVQALADSSVNFVFRVWTKTENYWDVYFAITEQIKRRFDAAGIQIPFPQMDVHVISEAA
ncbi:MAG TPA: mechanosensitive ion channel domain-containing protein [Spongiibacteraceae bacterium]|nr:mechanosensitive ion channel domain-containing protein [Spongiibacteraceae bacterium]